MSTPPRPSPNHHTSDAHPIDAARATLTVGRQAMPRPSRIWMAAKAASVPTEWSAMMRDAHSTEWATGVGLPCAVGASICGARIAG